VFIFCVRNIINDNRMHTAPPSLFNSLPQTPCHRFGGSQAAKERGASAIYAIDVNSDKFEIAKAFGATECLNPKGVNNDRQKMSWCGGIEDESAVPALGGMLVTDGGLKPT